jgi:hypothetical protein
MDAVDTESVLSSICVSVTEIGNRATAVKVVHRILFSQYYFVNVFKIAFRDMFIRSGVFRYS